MRNRLLVDGCSVQTEDPAQANSFLLALQAALEAAGRSTTYTTLAGITGVAFRLVPWEHDQEEEWQILGERIPFVSDALGLRWNLIGSKPTPSDPAWDWPTPGGRQATLLRAKAVPRTATTRWDDAATEEIRGLLGEGTPTLVYGGWPGAAGHKWGLIVGWQNDIFYGFHTRSTSLELLVRPPHVALAFPGPKTPRYSKQEVARHSLLKIALEAQWPASPHENVYDLWADLLLYPCEDPDGWMCPLRLAVLTRDARMAALRYLSEIRDHLPMASLIHLGELDLCYSQTTRTLIRDVDRSYVRAAFSAPDERQEMRERVLLIRRYESRAVAALGRLADDLK